MSSKRAITKDDVQANISDIIVRTVVEFGKPTTYVTVQMKNGFTLRESTTCVDPRNYSEAMGRAICLRKIEDKIYELLGYQLQSEIAEEDNGMPSEFVLTNVPGCVFSNRDMSNVGFIQNDLLYAVDDEGELITVPVYSPACKTINQMKGTLLSTDDDIMIGCTYILVSEEKKEIAIFKVTEIENVSDIEHEEYNVKILALLRRGVTHISSFKRWADETFGEYALYKVTELS